MRIKTSELTGVALDWAVAKADGHDMDHFQVVDAYQPSTDWAQGGPIIEREGICTKRQLPASAGYEWNSWQHTKFGNGDASGPTPLIAAMRCYVASKIGDEIEIPEELL